VSHRSLDKPVGKGIDDRPHTWIFAHADEKAVEIAALHIRRFAQRCLPRGN
jgi:hypothetical protein